VDSFFVRHPSVVLPRSCDPFTSLQMPHRQSGLNQMPSNSFWIGRRPHIRVMRSPPSSPIAYAGTPWTLQCLPSHDACNDGGAIRGTCLRRSRVGKGLHCLRRLRSMVPVSTQPPWTSSARLRPQASARSLRPHALQEGSKGVRGSRGDLNLMPPSPQQGTVHSLV
jgi:hypothetical protein